MRELHRQAGDQADRALLRDAALARIGRTRRWMLAGAAVLTAALAALASALLPGKSFGAGSHAAPAAPTNSAVAPALPAAANAAQLGLSSAGGGSGQAQQAPAPAPAPQPAPSPAGGGAAVVSGGS